MTVNKFGETAVGLGTTALGGGGLTMQAVMDGMSFALLALNLVLVVGGLVLLGCRLSRAFRR